MPLREDRDYHNPACVNVLPLALLLLPYALFRYAHRRDPREMGSRQEPNRNSPRRCTGCGATGRVRISCGRCKREPRSDCRACGGSGYIRVTCPRCHGTGNV